jgi:hypothetical protein
VTKAEGWTPATGLVGGAAVDDWLDTAKQRWRGTPHAAAALAWKCYSYWTALPAVLGYAVARRVPMLRADAVLARWSPHPPFVTVGLAQIEFAVLPGDPLAGHDTTVVRDEAALREVLRTTLIDDHLAGLMAQIRERIHLGRRALWGSVASGVAHGLSRAADVIPAPTLEVAHDLLAGLGLDGLVDLRARPDGRLDVQRRTCCLAFTLPEPKVCRGCVLSSP